METSKVGEIVSYPKEQGLGVIDEKQQIIPCENPNEAKILNMLFSILAKLNSIQKDLKKKDE
jgi:hypothetical protein